LSEDQHSCITCGDTAVVMLVVEVDLAEALATCAAADGGRQLVQTDLVGPVSAGDKLLVHAGAAIALEGSP